MTTHTYRVADHIFSISADDGLKSWPRLRWHFDPFVAEGDAEFSIDIRPGKVNTQGKKPLFIDNSDIEGQMKMDIFTEGPGFLFEMQQPFNTAPNAWLSTDGDMRSFTITVDEANTAIRAPWHTAGVNSGLMLAFMLATTKSRTLLSHAAAVVHGGKAYLFIGKSGTGKSTHTQLWLKNIADTMHLNDDHPVVRVRGDRVIAYGSPWSGKTDCYHASQAPIGAIVRLRQAPHNSIRRLSPIEAYASLTSSFSGMLWRADLADARHASVEALVGMVPCYQMDCLPDDDAARVCHSAVTAEI